MALVGNLSCPDAGGRPNSQAVSSTWCAWLCGRLHVLEQWVAKLAYAPLLPFHPTDCRYSWGRLEGFLPSPLACGLLWDRTHELTLSFDSQGIANM